MTTKRKAKDPFRSFRGDRNAAIERLRRVFAVAIEHLPPQLLNWLSYHAAMHIDVVSGGKVRLQDQLSKESEQANRGRRPKWSAADRELFRSNPPHRPPGRLRLTECQFSSSVLCVADEF